MPPGNPRRFCLHPPHSRFGGNCVQCWRCCLFPEVWDACPEQCGCNMDMLCSQPSDCPGGTFCQITDDSYIPRCRVRCGATNHLQCPVHVSRNVVVCLLSHVVVNCRHPQRRVPWGTPLSSQPCTECFRDAQDLFGDCTTSCPSGALGNAGLRNTTTPALVQAHVFLAFLAQEVSLCIHPSIHPSTRTPAGSCPDPTHSSLAARCSSKQSMGALPAAHVGPRTSSKNCVGIMLMGWHVAVMQIAPDTAGSFSSGWLTTDDVASWLAWEGVQGPPADRMIRALQGANATVS